MMTLDDTIHIGWVVFLVLFVAGSSYLRGFLGAAIADLRSWLRRVRYPNATNFCTGCGKPITGDLYIIKGSSVGMSTMIDRPTYHPLCTPRRRTHVLLHYPNDDLPPWTDEVLKVTKSKIITRHGSFSRSTGRILPDRDYYITDEEK